jgi:hypothetical protein
VRERGAREHLRIRLLLDPLSRRVGQEIFFFERTKPHSTDLGVIDSTSNAGTPGLAIRYRGQFSGVVLIMLVRRQFE